MKTLNGVPYDEESACAQCGGIEWVRPEFLPGDWNQRVTMVCARCMKRPENRSAAGTLCHAHFERKRGTEDRLTMADVLACPDCVSARMADERRIQATHTIDPSQPYGQHIALTCQHHPDLRWHTKNIDYIGARTIFCASNDECQCPMSDLVVVKL